MTTRISINGENVGITLGGRPESLRKRFTIPATDQTTQDWFDAQDNPSLSLRLLILEEVRTHGIVDRMNRLGNRVLTHVASQAQAAATAATGVPLFQGGPASASAQVPTPFAAAAPTNAATPASPTTHDAELAAMRDELSELRKSLEPVLPFLGLFSTEIKSSQNDPSGSATVTDQASAA